MHSTVVVLCTAMWGTVLLYCNLQYYTCTVLECGVLYYCTLIYSTALYCVLQCGELYQQRLWQSSAWWREPCHTWPAAQQPAAAGSAARGGPPLPWRLASPASCPSAALLPPLRLSRHPLLQPRPRLESPHCRYPEGCQTPLIPQQLQHAGPVTHDVI